jgi:hypothetical protein
MRFAAVNPAHVSFQLCLKSPTVSGFEKRGKSPLVSYWIRSTKTHEKPQTPFRVSSWIAVLPLTKESGGKGTC